MTPPMLYPINPIARISQIIVSNLVCYFYFTQFDSGKMQPWLFKFGLNNHLASDADHIFDVKFQL
jgi:hypothetical protein